MNSTSRKPISFQYSHRLTTALSVWCLFACIGAKAQAPTPGTLDSSFNPTLANFATTAYAVGVQADGKILVGGDFSKVNGVTQNYFTRLNPNGSLDTPAVLGLAGGDGYIRCLAPLSDGRIVVGGDFWAFNGANWRGVALLNADLTPDTSFGQYAGIANGKVLALAVQSDGKILIGGSFETVNQTPRSYIARLNPNGSLDNNFNAAADYNVNALALRPNGKILVGGEFTHINNTLHRYMVQLNSDGTVDSSFNIDLDYVAQSIALQTNGQAVISGSFGKVNGFSQNFIARLNLDGSRDGTFTANASGTVYALNLQTNGKILVGGRFSTVNNVTCNNLARLNTNGILDATFATGVGPNSTVRSMALQNDGNIVISGDFTQVSMAARTYIARLIGDPPPPPPAPEGIVQISTAVEISWTSRTNSTYQVQWAPEVAPTQWQDLGQPIAGNGTTNWVFDSTRDASHKFYRVMKIP